MECRKAGLIQRNSGDWQLRLTITQADMDQRLTSAPIGTRYACVLVEVRDDQPPAEHKPADGDRWRALGPAKQAGIRCKDAVFWAWLSEEQGFTGINSETLAAGAVRELCSVESRADLAKPGMIEARTMWQRLDGEFLGWKARENA
jgi:hypothetical protein